MIFSTIYKSCMYICEPYSTLSTYTCSCTYIPLVRNRLIIIASRHLETFNKVWQMRMVLCSTCKDTYLVDPRTIDLCRDLGILGYW